jgi:hypothetical protein
VLGRENPVCDDVIAADDAPILARNKSADHDLAREFDASEHVN